MMSYICGCIIGSAPEIVITDEPSAASLSIRASITSMSTGSLVLSNSLQYVHARLHRRIGTMCTSTGCFVDAKARTVCRTPRVNMLKLLAFSIPVKLRLVNPLLYGLDFVISNASVPYGGTITSIVGEWTGPVRAFRAARGYFLFNHR